MEFSVRIQGLDQLVAKLREAPSIAAPILARALSASQAILAKHTTKDTVPWRTGFLVQSFRAEQTTGMLRWFPTADYAVYVHEGTKPHPINNAFGRGITVRHPGTKANPFLERIVTASQEKIDATFVKALEMITAKIAAN